MRPFTLLLAVAPKKGDLDEGKWKYLGNYKLTIDYGEKQTWALDSNHEHLITRDGGRLTRAPVE